MPRKWKAARKRKKRWKWTDGVAVAVVAWLAWRLLTPVIHPSPKAEAIPSNISTLIQQASHSYDVPINLVEGVIAQESSMNPDAVSSAGALGLMQLMPDTAQSLGVTDPFDPKQNIMAGTKYLSELLHRYHGNEKLALAAYNAGPAEVDKYQGVPPFPETERYVHLVLEYSVEYAKH